VRSIGRSIERSNDRRALVRIDARMRAFARSSARACLARVRARCRAGLERAGASEADVDAVVREVFRGPFLTWPRPRRGEGWARREGTVEEVREGEAAARRATRAFERATREERRERREEREEG
jgi:hypothetical protein